MAAAASPDEHLRVQLMDLERQILDEYEYRQQIGDRLAQLETENSKLRSLLSVWKQSVEAPIATRSGSSSISSLDDSKFDPAVPSLAQDVLASPPVPLDPVQANALDVCLLLSAANANARAQLLKHLDQRRSLALELSHLHRQDRLRWEHLIQKAQSKPVDLSILGDESPFENVTADVSKLAESWKSHFSALAGPAAAAAASSNSTPSTSQPSALFVGLHPSLVTACYKTGAPYNSGLPAPFSASTFQLAGAAVPPHAPRSALGVGATLSVASGIEVDPFEHAGNSLAGLMAAAGLGLDAEAADSDAAPTENALQFVVTALEANRAAYTEARAAIDKGGDTSSNSNVVFAELAANRGFAPISTQAPWAPTALMLAAETGLPSGIYPFDQADSDDNIIQDVSASAATASTPTSATDKKAGADAPSDGASASTDPLELPIRFASLYKLVERLCNAANDIKLRYVFLLTYRSFTNSPLDLLAALQHRYYVPYPPNVGAVELEMFRKNVIAPIQIKVCSVLKNWIEEHWLADFVYTAPDSAHADPSTPSSQKALQREEQAEQLLAEMKAFLQAMSVPQHNGPWAVKSAKALLAMIKKKESAGTANSLIASKTATSALQLLMLGAQPTPQLVMDSVMEIGLMPTFNGIEFAKALCREMPFKDFVFADTDELEIARQLTLLDFNYFKLIMPREMVDTAWSKKDRLTAAPHICAFIDQFNAVSCWVQKEIVEIENISKRASMLRRFIKIADHLRELNNFNSLFAIYCGLGANPIYRLKKTWADLSAKTMAKWEEIKTLFKIDGNSKNFRETLKTTICPCIPYLGLFLGDLTFMEDGNPGMGGPKGNLINVQKRRMISDRIKWIQQYQQTGYAFKPIKAIQEYLQINLKQIDENTLYKQSLVSEPRDSS